MTVSERLARLEAELSRLQPSHDRLEKRERGAPRRSRQGFARFFAWIGPAMPQLLASVVMLVLGFWIKDSVDLAIRQQELQLSFVKEMKEQLEAMAKKEATLEDIERAAVLVAAFGQPAVMPLLNELRYGGNRALGAESGLRALAFMNTEAVCELVPRVVASPARMLAWEGHMGAARILAAGKCTAALPVLRAHIQVIERVRDGQAPEHELTALASHVPKEVEDRKEWLKVLHESVAVLSRT